MQNKRAYRKECGVKMIQTKDKAREEAEKIDFCDNNGNCMGMFESKIYTDCKHFEEWSGCENVCIHFLFSEDIGLMTCNRLEETEANQ
jgi:hypothetical protein